MSTPIPDTLRDAAERAMRVAYEYGAGAADAAAWCAAYWAWREALKEAQS
jgi:hypothetical protein